MTEIKNISLSLQISSAEIFLIGAVAKAVATTATYPLQTVQAILRVNSFIVKINALLTFSMNHKCVDLGLKKELDCLILLNLVLMLMLSF